MRRVIWKRRFWPTYFLGIVTALLALVLWHGIESPPAAYGQIPDSGAQRLQIILELKTMNQKLAEIADLLRAPREPQAGSGAIKTAKPPAGHQP